MLDYLIKFIVIVLEFLFVAGGIHLIVCTVYKVFKVNLYKVFDKIFFGKEMYK